MSEKKFTPKEIYQDSDKKEKEGPKIGEVINLSFEPLPKLYNWLPYDLVAEKVVFLPDACPGKSPLPTGVAVLTNHDNWRKFAISDVGCGMLVVKSRLSWDEFEDTKKEKWNNIYEKLKANRNKGLGDLGSGNHFLDSVVDNETNEVCFVIHTGSRAESGIVDSLIDKPREFDQKYQEVTKWAKDNREAIAEILKDVFGDLEFVLDKSHNSFEQTDEGIIIRKGAVKLKLNEQTIIPSNMDDDMVIVTATDKIDDSLNSMSHGTGRKMSRSEAKEQAQNYNYQNLRERIYIPSEISDDSIKTEAPFCYRDINECLNLISPYIKIEKRLSPIAYIGQV